MGRVYVYERDSITIHIPKFAPIDGFYLAVKNISCHISSHSDRVFRLWEYCSEESLNGLSEFTPEMHIPMLTEGQRGIYVLYRGSASVCVGSHRFVSRPLHAATLYRTKITAK